MRLALPILLLAGPLGCAKPPDEASATVDELSASLLRDFEGDSPETTASA